MLLDVQGVLDVLDVLALSGFDDGNMPAIQLIPREGLKSPHSDEGWIVVWSRKVLIKVLKKHEHFNFEFPAQKYSFM